MEKKCDSEKIWFLKNSGANYEYGYQFPVKFSFG